VTGIDDFDCETTSGETRCRLEPGVAPGCFGTVVSDALLQVREGRVAIAAVFFDEGAYASVLERLTNDLGAGEDRSEQLRAGMGGTFTNVVKVWRREGSVWFAEQFAGRIDRSSVSRANAADFDAMMRARAAQRVNGARDL